MFATLRAIAYHTRMSLNSNTGFKKWHVLVTLADEILKLSDIFFFIEGEIIPSVNNFKVVENNLLELSELILFKTCRKKKCYALITKQLFGKNLQNDLINS